MSLIEAMLASAEVDEFCGNCIRAEKRSPLTAKCIEHNKWLDFDVDFKQWKRVDGCKERIMKEVLK